MRELIAQLKVDFLAEYRSWAETAGIVIFMWVLSYILFRIRPDLNLPEFNFILWVIFLLVSLNVAFKGANHHSSYERAYLYTVISPTTAFISRFVFNLIYLLITITAFYLSMIMLYFPQIFFSFKYFLLIVVASFAIGSVISFVGVVARHATGQNTILSILSLPLLIPVVIIVYEMGRRSVSK